MKLFGEFSKDDKESNLAVYCFTLKSDEINDLITSLDGKGFTLIFIDADSLKARIIGKYEKVNEERKRLEVEGFKWVEQRIEKAVG